MDDGNAGNDERKANAGGQIETLPEKHCPHGRDEYNAKSAPKGVGNAQGHGFKHMREGIEGNRIAANSADGRENFCELP